MDSAYHLEKRHKSVKEFMWIQSQHGNHSCAKSSDFSNERTTTDKK